MIKIKPIYNRLLVKEEKIDKSSLLTVSLSKKTTVLGKVIAVGQGMWNKKKNQLLPLTSVKKNDYIFFRKPEIKIKVKDEIYYILNEEDILAIYNLN